MPTNNTKRIVAIIVVSNAFAVLCAFIFAIFSFSADQTVPGLATRWEWATALSWYFAWSPALQFLAIAIALAGASGNARELVQASIIPAIVVSVLISAATLIGQPYATGTVSAINLASESFNRSLSDAKRSLDAGDIASARSDYTLCRSISRDDPRVVALEKKIILADAKYARDNSAAKNDAQAGMAAAGNAAQANTRTGMARSNSVIKPDTAIGQASAQALYFKALEYADRKDWINAHWYASEAYKLDPGYSSAARLAATAWDNLYTSGFPAVPGQGPNLFLQEIEAYSRMQSGDPIGGFGLWAELAKEYPDNEDIRHYLALSREQVEKIAFFLDEMDDQGSFYYLSNAFLTLTEGSQVRFIVAKDVLFASGSAYFREFEFIEANNTEVRVSVRSPYAKLTAGILRLICIDQGTPGRILRPTWLEKSSDSPESIISIALPVSTVYRVLTARNNPAELSALDAWRAARVAPTYGVDNAAILIDLQRRSSIPFAVFGAITLGCLAGSRFRGPMRPMPKRYYGLVPFMAAALVPVSLLCAHANLLVSELALDIVPGVDSLWLGAGIRAVVLGLLIVLLAGSRREKAPRIVA